MTQPETRVVAQIVNGFVQAGTGGNPAGVVLDADRLDADTMQRVAASIGASETAFVSRSTTEGFKLDFFTPTRRIAHCGHATIATFSLLASLGRVKDGITFKETVDGPRRIIIRNGAAYMEQVAPRYDAEAKWRQRGVTKRQVLDALGLPQSGLSQDFEPSVVNTGNSFLIIGAANRTTLEQLSPDMAALHAISDALDLIGVYVFTTDPAATTKDATTRMFAPRYGIEEEAATGMAAGPLACYLHDIMGMTKSHFEIEQGHFMAPPSPSIIDVDLEMTKGKITGLMAGGHGKVIEEMTITV